MNDNEKQFEDFVHNIKFDDTPDAAHRNKLEQKLLNKLTNQHQQRHSPLEIWRLIMKNRTTKLATAAVIILIAVFGITVLDKSVSPAYAIEQTIEAFKKVNSVYVEQIIREEGTLLNTKLWARRGEDGKFFFGDYRQESVYGDITVANEGENRTYYYNPSTKEVYIWKGLTVTIGSFLDIDFFLYLKEEMEDVEIEYGKDEITGKDVVSLKYKEPSKFKSKCKCGVITFDLESKLPNLFKLWDNRDFKGEPWLEWTLIEYNPKLPEDTFKFEIPEDATVIKEPNR